MRLLSLLCLFVLVVLCATLVHGKKGGGGKGKAWGRNQKLDPDWKEFKNMFKKKYGGEEKENMRREKWEKNMERITAHNEKFQQGKSTYEEGPNEYSDLDADEMRDTLTGLREDGVPQLDSAPEGWHDMKRRQTTDLPDSVNWVDEGYVTPVKNQGQCGSCWAFASIGAMEALYVKNGANLTNLSEQYLVDCVDWGCNGGHPYYVYNYVCDNTGNAGVPESSCYAYTGQHGTCQTTCPSAAGVCSNFGWVYPEGDEQDLQWVLANHGPAPVAMDFCTNENLMSYKSGVFYDDPTVETNPCTTSALCHAVLAVGYGTTEDGEDYWLIKNSWGESWGESGYMRLARNKDNHCGVATSVYFPI